MNHQTIGRTLLACLMVGGVVIPSAFGNHRTGDFPLPELLVVGDFNQDRKLDLAVNVAGFDNLAIFAGDGQGGFTLIEHVKTDTLPKGLATGDLNADGHLDLATISQWGYNVQINLGDGAGAFTFIKELNGDGEPTRILAKDVNGDGQLDLIANAPAEGKILLYFGDGKGGFSNSATELEDLSNDFGIATGDFNNDGKPDIAATEFANMGSDETRVVIYLGDGVGGFNKQGDFVVNPQAGSLAVGDLNHDGNLDLVVGGAGPENETGLFVSTYLGDGAGNFITGQITDLGPGAAEGEMALGDFNEDGNLDVAFPVFSFQGVTASTTVFIFPGDGTGHLGAGQVVTVGKQPHSTVTADFNQDGHLDLAVTNRTDGTLSILFGDGTGTFTTHATIPVAVLPIP